MKTTIFALLLLRFLNFAHGQVTHEADKKFCITKHVKSALKLNKERKKFYANLTQGKSRSASNALIFAERSSLPISLVLDTLALRYQKKGIPILCKDLISMSNVQSPTSFGEIPKVKFNEIIAPKPKAFSQKLKSLANNNHQKEFDSLLREEIQRLNKTPQYYCVYRHFLESLLRTSKLMPEYREQALQLGTKVPDQFLWRYIRLHIIPLAHLVKIDQKAAPFQEQGLPIFCQDVPHIPTDF